MSILFCSAFLYIKKGEIRFWSAICDPTLFREFFLLFVHIFLSIQLFVSVWSINRCFILIRSGFFFFVSICAHFYIPNVEEFFANVFYLCITSAPLAWRAVVTGIKLNISTENGTCTVRGKITCDLSTDNWNAFQSSRSYRWFRTADECYTVNRRKRLISFKNL